MAAVFPSRRSLLESVSAYNNSEFPGDQRNPASGVWDRVDQFVLNRVLRSADGKLAEVRLIVIDSGGHCTTKAYRYCSSRRPRIFVLKGYGGHGKPIIIGGRTTAKSQSAWRRHK